MTDATIAIDAGPTPPGIGPRVAATMEVGDILLRRWAGAWIDFIALPLVAAPFFLLGMDHSWAGLAAIAGLLAALAYFPITEGLWGRSAGKLVTGTIVVTESGGPPGVLRAIVRTLLRLVEVNPFLLGGLPAGFFAFASKHHQRLGDMCANTYVVPFKALRTAQASSPRLAAFD